MTEWLKIKGAMTWQDYPENHGIDGLILHLQVHLQFPNLDLFFTFSRTKYRVASKSFQIELLDVCRQPIKLF